MTGLSLLAQCTWRSKTQGTRSNTSRFLHKSSTQGSAAAPLVVDSPAPDPADAVSNPEFASRVRTMTNTSNTFYVNSVLHAVSALVDEGRNFTELSFLPQQCLNQIQVQDPRPLNPISGSCGSLHGTSRCDRGRPATDDLACNR